MLSGKTSVFIDTTKSDDDPEDVAAAAQNAAAEKDVASVTSDDTGVQKKNKLDRSKYGKFIIHFGESDF